jgi:hypothetical protein
MSGESNADRFGSRCYLLLVLMPYLLGLVGYWAIVVADPYGLRGTGLSVRLGDHRYPDREWPRLIGPLTSEAHDLALLGGSSTMWISPQIMQEAFPGARNPINLSYLAPRPLDLAQILASVGQIKDLKRVILVLDFTLLEQRQLRSATGDDLANMSTTSWSHGGDFSWQTALASMHRIVKGSYDLPMWSRLEIPEFMSGQKPVTQSASVMRRFRVAVNRHADDVFASTTLDCSQIPFISGVLEPFLARMAQQQVAVDMVFPPVPYIVNYDWIENRPRWINMLPGPVFEQLMAFKKCVIAARERVDGKLDRVIALDSNDAISGDLGHYEAFAHLIGSDLYRTVMHMIATGDETITSANVDQYEAALRMKVSRGALQMATATTTQEILRH